MLSNNLTFMVDRDYMAGVLDIDLLANQAIRHAVKAFVHRNMVIDMHLCFFPVADGEAFFGQRGQTVLFQLQKQLFAAFAILIHQAAVECIELFGNGGIELFETEEPPIPQRSQNASLYLEYAGFDLRLIPRLSYPCWEHCHRVVTGKISEGRIDFRVIVTGMRYATFQVIDYQKLWTSAEILERLNSRCSKVFSLLGCYGTGERIGCAAKYRNIEFRSHQLAGCRIDP